LYKKAEGFAMQKAKQTGDEVRVTIDEVRLTSDE
jgi:hypothetical protein